MAILGVIAVFSIPKIISAQQNTANTAKVKEAMGALTGALMLAQANGTISTGSSVQLLTPYLNYVSVDTSGTQIDATPPYVSWTCNASTPCYKMHNGAVISFEVSSTFSGTTPLHCVEGIIDPDGSQNTLYIGDVPYKAVMFDLYWDGLITTRGKTKPGTILFGAVVTPYPPGDPSWFVW